MADEQLPLVPGTLEMLVLKTLSLAPQHGWGIGERIQQLSRDAFRVNQGTLYPVLERLQQHGWIVADWRASENNRRAKYYALTRAGARRLADEERDWERSIRAIQLIMRTAE
jgi:PadR family transcriptional regulator, regulatory protein PadR